jgi:hypothetical protein
MIIDIGVAEEMRIKPEIMTLMDSLQSHRKVTLEQIKKINKCDIY